MQKVARRLKISIILTALFLLPIYLFVFPVWGKEASIDEGLMYAYVPWLIYLSLTGIPLFMALWEAYKISNHIEKEEIFTKENTESLRKIANLALIDVIYFFVGMVVMTIFVINHPGIMLMQLVICLFGIIIYIIFNSLASLTSEADKIREENELTI